MNPPTVAAWLLEHLARGAMTDALAGDLREEFGRRQSPSWYWRQVLAAVGQALLNRFRVGWPCAAFAVLWSCAATIFTESAAHLLFPWGRSAPRFILLPWPWSLAAEMALDVLLYALPLAAGQAACLLLEGRFRFRRFGAAILLGVALLTLAEIILTFVGPSEPVRLTYTLLFLLALLAGTTLRPDSDILSRWKTK